MQIDNTLKDVPKGAIKRTDHIAMAALEAIETEDTRSISEGLRYLLYKWAKGDPAYREGATDALIALTGYSLPTLVEQGTKTTYCKEDIE